MADTDVVADGGATFLVRAVYNCAVLDINFIAHPDKVDIAAHNRLKPDRAVVAHRDIADDSGVVRQKAIFAQNRRKIATRNNECHNSAKLQFKDRHLQSDF
jgi:hypothetical protein